MTDPTPDGQLMAQYATERSEAAFAALVRRHGAMVHASALRQVGQSSLAEEVTQNTFVALARKARRLQQSRTLAGWLHRTALLEAKACVRRECRRRRREMIAAEMASIGREGDSLSAPLLPLLDEAMLHLREADRQAVVLRFLEGCTLREVGRVLGIEEETARKRVTRAVERVARFFRQRGFAVPTAVVSATMAAQASQTVPAGLASACSQQAASLAGTSNSFLSGLNLMSLSKSQTAVATLLLASIPLAWQWRAEASLEERKKTVEEQQILATERLSQLRTSLKQQQDDLVQLQAEEANASLRLARREDQAQSRKPLPTYQWDEASPLARIPKALLARLDLRAVRDRLGTIDERMALALQMTEPERRAAQSLLNRFLERYHARQAARMHPAEPDASDLRNRDPAQVRAFAVPHDPIGFQSLRQDLFQDLESLLGSDRTAMFQKGLQDWMPLGDVVPGLNSGRVVINTDHRFVFYEPEAGEGALSWTLKVEERGSMHMTTPLPELDRWLPGYLRRELVDWIDLARPVPEELP